MARRDLEVRIRADVGAYRKAMSGAIRATDEFARAGLAMQRKGMQISQIGDNLTRRVTLPLLAVGAAATKMSLDFDRAFVQMQTLAGVSAGAVDGLKDSVLELSGETGRSPRELADALYFLQSAGLDSEQAMAALEVSAKASAIGLGSTEVVADAVSSAMLAYAESGLTAAEATDVLIATARAGKAEPAELASQLGRLLPIASELGIRFGDVGGALAVLSTRGSSAEQSSTQLLGVMSSLIKPSRQAEQALADVGLSLDDVRKMIAERGLLGTILNLKNVLGEAGFRLVFDDVRALTGALALLGGDLDKTKDIFGEVNDSIGVTESAFATWAESMGAENAQAFAQFQVALIRLGDVLAPIATDVISMISKIAEAFAALPDGVQKGIIFAGLFAAAMGPLLSVGGRVVTMVGTLTRLLPALAVPAGTVSGAFNGAAVATSRFSLALGALTKATLVVGALIALREVLGTIDDEIDKASLSELENQLLTLGQSGEIAGDTLKRVFAGLESGTPFDARQLASDLDLLDDALAKLALRDPDAAAAAFEKIKDALEGQGASVSQVEEAFDGYGAALAEADTASRTAEGGLGDAEDAMADLGLETENTTSALQEFADAVKAQFDPLFAMIDAQKQSVEAQRELREAEEELNEARKGGDQDKITAAEDRLREARISGAKSIVDQQVAANQLKDALDSGTVSAEDAAAQIIAMGVAQGWTKAQTMTMAAELGVATEVANELARTDPTVDVTETGNRTTRMQMKQTELRAKDLGNQRPNVRVEATDSASGIIGAVKERLRLLDGKSATVTIRQVYQQSGLASSTLGKALERQHGGPVKMGQAYVVGETQPELFVPDRDGMILPSVPSMGHGTPWGGGGGGRLEVHITDQRTTVRLDGRVIAEELRQWNARNSGRNSVRVR